MKFGAKIFRSLRVRIFLFLLAVGIIPCIILRNGILNSYEDRAVSVRGMDVQNQLMILSNQLISSDYMLDQSSEVINGQLDQLSNMYDGRILITDRNFKIIKDTYGLDEAKTIVSEEVFRCFKGENIVNYDPDNHYIELTVPIKDQTSKEVIGVMITSVSTDSIMDNLDVLGSKSLVLVIAISAVILMIAVYLASFFVRPFSQVTHSIEEVSEGYGDENKLSIPGYVETEQLAEAFNRMLAHMKVLDDSRQEFVSNVSHELKTPITSMKVLADSLLMQEDVPVELYKEFMGDIAQEIDRESQIISDLLSLVKLDKKASDLNIAPVNINEMLESILKRLRPIAAQRNIELVFESFRPVTAEIDEVKLSLAFSNLVENAIKYNIDNGWVHVSLNADHKYFYVKVSDSGMGIPEESVEHIFERFYRVDKSRSREIGGTGLGLAITRSAILMHRGAIKVYSKENEGTTFTVRVPLNYIA